MKNLFKEYHQFTKEEFEKLWKECIFVFDTNTLLNMYRYSRSTVDNYFEVLTELKNNKQLWIPHQVGYEFFENRINVISEYEKSYDEILSTLTTTKENIDKKYKNHPFLDLKDIKEKIDKGLSSVIKDIEDKKNKHPKWLENDEVLKKINELFNGNVGKAYDEQKINEITKDGQNRYEKKIPPGFKDNNKPNDKKFGDLILWFQIIDKAIEFKKPIILVSGDVKEDWWLEKEGKRIMPLPQLKKEMLDKAKVDFHIYTADKFLEYHKPLKSGSKRSVDEKMIDEVRKIRELEEVKAMLFRKAKEENFRDEFEINFIDIGTDPIKQNRADFRNLLSVIEGFQKHNLKTRYRIELESIYLETIEEISLMDTDRYSKKSIIKIHRLWERLRYLIDEMLHEDGTDEALRLYLKKSRDNSSFAPKFW